MFLLFIIRSFQNYGIFWRLDEGEGLITTVTVKCEIVFDLSSFKHTLHGSTSIFYSKKVKAIYQSNCRIFSCFSLAFQQSASTAWQAYSCTSVWRPDVLKRSQDNLTQAFFPSTYATSLIPCGHLRLPPQLLSLPHAPNLRSNSLSPSFYPDPRPPPLTLFRTRSSKHSHGMRRVKTC